MVSVLRERAGRVWLVASLLAGCDPLTSDTKLPTDAVDGGAVLDAPVITPTPASDAPRAADSLPARDDGLDATLDDAQHTATVDAASPIAEGLPCDLQELLNSHCVGCHDGTGLKAPVALAKRSDLLQPSAHKTANSVGELALQRMRSASAPMPPDAPLSHAQAQLLAGWLEDGSPAVTCEAPNEPVAPFESASLPSALSKVKMLLTGQAVSADELTKVTRDPRQLPSLIDGWQQTPEFEDKLRAFFEVAFQQSELSTTLLFQQLGSTVVGEPALLARLVENIEQSFARTALRIVKDGRPFTETLSTREMELTPALMSYLLLLDEQPITDAGRRTLARVVFSVSTEGEPISFTDSIDAASPNYLKFTAIGATAGCVDITRSSRSGVDLFSYLLGRTPRTANCGQSRSPPIFTDQDFTSFRTVKLDKVALNQSRLRFYDLPALRESTQLSVLIPRLGFFSTPAFLANYPTNDSNQMRVTANQTLIVALGASFNGTDVTEPLTHDGLTGQHAAPGTACYACHKALDPMRMFFRQAFTLGYSDQRDLSVINQSASLALGGVSKSGIGLEGLAQALVEQPRFARAWTQKLCFYANSLACLENDPEFMRIADRFAESGHDFRVLVRELFSSPLVTHLADSVSARSLGTAVGIARRNHFCQALSTRLKISDVCGQAAVVSRAAAAATVVAETLPKDSYSRGQEQPVTPNQGNLFTRSAFESLCVMVAPQALTGAAGSPLPYNDFRQTLGLLRRQVMGLADGDARAEPAQAILQDHFFAALSAGHSTLNALRSTFVLACTAPSTVSVGL